MTERPPTVKQQAFAAGLYTIGSQTYGNGTESARKAGYKGNDVTLATIAKENIRKLQVIKLRDKIQAKAVKKANITMEECVLSLAEDIRDEKINKRDKYKAMDLLGEFLGWKKDKAPNAEREAAKLKHLDTETKRLARVAAYLLTRTQPVIEGSAVAVEGGKAG